MLQEILSAGKTGLAPDLYTLMEGQCFFRSVGDEEKELTGALPLSFRSNGSDLLDWRITGAEGGAGRPGMNYLKMEETEVSDGGGGVITYSYSTAIWEAVPPEASYDKEYQQWVIPVYGRYRQSGEYFYAIDDREPGYDSCIWFADLKPGEYKLIVEAFNDYCYFNHYGWNTWYRLPSGKFPYVSLFTQGADEPLLSTPIFTEIPPDRKFLHEEYKFTVSEAMKVGFFGVFPNACRFMIVDGDVEAKSFSDPHNSKLYGKTCWEPFHYELPITVTCGDEATAVVIDLGQELLYPEDSISLADTGITIPTYSGKNIIDTDADIKPSEMYIKYRG